MSTYDMTLPGHTMHAMQAKICAMLEDIRIRLVATVASSLRQGCVLQSNFNTACYNKKTATIPDKVQVEEVLKMHGTLFLLLVQLLCIPDVVSGLLSFKLQSSC